jgi:hypothetical protein
MPIAVADFRRADETNRMPSKTSLQLAARYTRVLKLAEAEPLAALASWRELFAEHSSAPLLAIHARALRLLTDRITHFPHPTEAALIVAAIGSAREELDEARALSSIDTKDGMGFTLADPPSVRGNAEGMMPLATTPRRLLTDVIDLKRVAADWSEEDWRDWLLDGFSEILEGSREAYSAFPPLRLYPVGNYLAQLGDALTDGQPADSPVRDRVATALKHHLAAGGVGDARDSLSWELFAEFGLADPNARIARLFITKAVEMRSPISDETIEQICAYGWLRCVNETARADFFRSIALTVGDRIAGWNGAAAIEETAEVLPESEGELFQIARTLTASDAFRTDRATVQLEWILKHGGLPEFARYGSRIASVLQLRRTLSNLALKANAREQWGPPKPIGAKKILEGLGA